jgi:hypothetical protein
LKTYKLVDLNDKLVNNGLKHQLLIEQQKFWNTLSDKSHSYKTGHWDGMMSDEILFKTLTVIISLAHVIKDLWTAVNSVASMIEVTTMFPRSSLGRDTGRNRKQEGLLTGNNRQNIKIDESIIPKTTNKTNNVTIIATALTMLSSCGSSRYAKLREENETL